MRSSSLTARSRLTLVVTALYAFGGAVLVTITYALVAQNVAVGDINTPLTDATFRKECASLGTNGALIDDNLKQKCATAVKMGAEAAADAQRRSMLDNLLLYSVLTLIVTTALAAALAWVIAGRILRPVRRLTEAARNAGENSLGQRLDPTGPHDELRELGETFDDMLDRLESAFVAQRSFIANASHELRTPLTVMRTTLDVVLAKPSPTRSNFVALGAELSAEIDNANALIASLLTLARTERGAIPMQLLDLSRVVAAAVARADFGGLSLRTELDPAPIDGDPLLVELLVSNLLSNAIRYNVAGGTVDISTSRGEGVALLRVANTGAIVLPDRVVEIFQPFTRLNERIGTEGFGLGLSVVESIAHAHHGSVSATAPPTGGLVVVVRLPLSRVTPPEGRTK